MERGIQWHRLHEDLVSGPVSLYFSKQELRSNGICLCSLVFYTWIWTGIEATRIRSAFGNNVKTFSWQSFVLKRKSDKLPLGSRWKKFKEIYSHIGYPDLIVLVRSSSRLYPIWWHPSQQSMFICSLPLGQENPLWYLSRAETMEPIISTKFSGEISRLLALLQEMLRDQNEPDRGKDKNLRGTSRWSDVQILWHHLHMENEWRPQQCNSVKEQQKASEGTTWCGSCTPAAGTPNGVPKNVAEWRGDTYLCPSSGWI